MEQTDDGIRMRDMLRLSSKCSVINHTQIFSESDDNSLFFNLFLYIIIILKLNFCFNRYISY